MRKATFWHQATPGVTYYRATLPARFLPGKVQPLSYCDVTEIAGKIVFPSQEGAAIWSFPGNNTRALLMVEMQEQGIRVLSEFDDNYTIPPPFYEISQWRKTRDEPGVDIWDMHTYQTACDICQFVDGVIVSTPFLEGVYGKLNPNVFVCPNSIDPDDWDPNPSHQKDGILRVGWAASDSHIYDAKLIVDALAWASTKKDVEVVIMGIKPWISNFRFDYTHIPWADSLAQYRKNVQNIDVMLCPLIPGEWSDAKSDVKALEAAMGGACSIVSETEPYRPWFDRTYVAKHPWDWKKILKHLVRSREEVAETARAAREYAAVDRNIRKHVWRWQEAVAAKDAVAA